MSAFHLIEELKLGNINFDATLLPKHNPYVGYFPSIWPLIIFPPAHKNASTQTDYVSYFELGKKVATDYGDGWELLVCDSRPSIITGTK